MEDFSIKAIVIGVSLFVTMLTLSAILIYFNTARGIGDEVNKRTDIAEAFDIIVNSDNFEDELTGVEIRSLIKKYIRNKSVVINIINEDGDVENSNINTNWAKKIDNTWDSDATKDVYIISEAKLNEIDPSHNYTVEKVENSGKTTLNIKKK